MRQRIKDGLHNEVRLSRLLSGPLPEDEAYSTRMLLEDKPLVASIQGYECTKEIKYSETNPEVFARVWKYITNEVKV